MEDILSVDNAKDSLFNDTLNDSDNMTIVRPTVHEDVVTKFLRLIETQHLLGENCTAGTHLNLGEGVVDRYAQERFRIEAEVAVNRANMLTRLWKYAGPSVMHNEYLLHASVFSMVEFDDDVFAAGNCYDQYQYKDYQLFCPFAYRLPEGPILAKDLAVEYKYLSNTSEWFYIARKNAERVIRNHNQFKRGYNTYTYNDTAHTEREFDEILSVTYEDGKWSKPYYDCGGGNIWMLTYTVPFFGYNNGTYFFKGTSGIDIDLRRVDIDQCPLKPGSTQLNIFAGTDKCKKKTTECVPVPGLGFRRGSYRCLCRRGFYFPNTTAENRYYNGSDIEEEYEKHLLHQLSLYSMISAFECLPCAEGCEACVDGSPCVAALNWVVRSSILALACFVISCLPFIVYFTIKYGHVRVVRAASPALLRVIVLGAALIYCTTLVMYGRPTVFTCTLRVWLREVGFCLTYGALMLKTWRISMIFEVRSAKAVKISDMYLLRRIGVIVGVACVLLSIRTLVAPPAVIVGRTREDLKAYLCNTDWWDHSFTTLEVIFLMWGIRLCIMVRKAPSDFNESRFISMAIYNEFLLSGFLNISMLFLQSPANPDLLYIIFFCHTQLTVTLLLLFIFGSKAYMVFRGHGKDDKDKTGKFRTRPADSTYTMTTNNTHFCDNMTERELEEEFKKLCSQLDRLRERCGSSSNIARCISEMREAANRNERRGNCAEHSAPLRLNNVFNAVAGRLMCNVTPGEESSSSGRDIICEAPPTCRQRATPTKSGETSNAEQSQTDVTTDSPKKKDDQEPNEETQNGVFRISGEANCSDVRPPDMSNINAPSTSSANRNLPSTSTARNLPSTSRDSRDIPSTSTAYIDVPSTSTAYRDVPSTSTSYRDEPSTSTAYRDAPSTSTAYRDEPSTSTAYRVEPSTSTSYRDVPSTSTAYRDEPSTSTSYRDVPSTSTAYRDEPSTSTSYRDVPSTSAANSDVPSTNKANRNGPSSSTVNRNDPSTSTNNKNNSTSDRSETRTSPSASESVRGGVRSGHARTHAIVINLDDKSRFTEEVTV
ncbi:PREDICTED: probable G-protein coupled receptor 158 [Papilio polytes]|uniref:probable G-protein coupled receptor 158 n=1 Tax=Papilio polytes TaxID=76194 RepID=UPI000675F46B|nr:PREDICTED: probable G-protein coupled receptor 158 [Papilio polytes]